MSRADKSFRKRYIGFVFAAPGMARTFESGGAGAGGDKGGSDGGEGAKNGAGGAVRETPTVPMPTRGEVIGTLRGMWRDEGGDPEDPRAPFLTAYEDGRGIVRCGHVYRDRVLELLRGLDGVVGRKGSYDLRFLTVLTSGSIRKVKLKLGLPTTRKRQQK